MWASLAHIVIFCGFFLLVWLHLFKGGKYKKEVSSKKVRVKKKLKSEKSNKEGEKVKEKMSMSTLNVRWNGGVEELLKRSVMKAVEEVITLCASKYTFSASEAKEALYPAEIELVRESWCASCGPCGSSKSSKNVEKKTAKKAANKPVAMAFPLPFSGVQKDECCRALRQNGGLYTQCANEKGESDRYCGQCSKQAEKSETGEPEYGTIESRMLAGLHDYVDSKGRKPVHYTKIMKKLNLSEVQVMELADKHGIKVDSSHFVAPVDASKRGRPKSEKSVNSVKARSGVKGRPKKEKKVVQIAGDEDDLFANLVAQANHVSPAESDADEEDAEVPAVAVAEVPEVLPAVAVAEVPEVLPEVLPAVVVAEVPAVKTVKTASDKAAEKAEKEAQKAAEKAEKEAQKVAEKAAKEAQKAAEKAAKAAEKAAKDAEKAEKVSQKAAEKTAANDEAEVVKKIEFAGHKYLKSKKTGIVYDYAEYVKTGDQIVVGQWNNETSAIDFKKACDDEEESEEEYEQ